MDNSNTEVLARGSLAMAKNNNNNKITTEHRITTLETNYGFIKNSVRNINKQLNNHYTTLDKKVNSIKTWLISVLVAVILLLLGLVLNLVLF